MSLVPGAELKVENWMLFLDLSGLQLPLPLPGPIRLQIGLEDGKVVARPLGAASAPLPTQPLLDRPEPSVPWQQQRERQHGFSTTLATTLTVPFPRCWSQPRTMPIVRRRLPARRARRHSGVPHSAACQRTSNTQLPRSVLLRCRPSMMEELCP